MDVETLALSQLGIKLKKIGREWHGACPVCRTGRDRFIVWKEGNYYCRQCGEKGFLKLDDSRKLSYNEIKALMQQREEESKAARKKSLESWQSQLDLNKVMSWHNNLTPEMRIQWNNDGIPDYVLDSYCVGFNPTKWISVDGNMISVPAYTIPIVSNQTKKIVNIQFRLVNPPAGVGKYRQVNEIPAAPAYMSEETEGDFLLIVEGWKKAVVVFNFIGKSFQVVGIPGIVVHPEIMESMRGFKKKVLMPDPFAVSDRKNLENAVSRFKKYLSNVYLSTVLWKPDDMIVSGKVSLPQFNSILDNARRIS